MLEVGARQGAVVEALATTWAAAAEVSRVPALLEMPVYQVAVAVVADQ